MVNKLHAQNFQVLYKVVFKPDIEKRNVKTEYMQLDVSENESFFYNVKYVKENTQADEQDYLRFFIRQKKGNYIYYGSLNDLHFKYEDTIPQNWIIKDRTAFLKGYNVQEAAINFEGRQWKAFFTKDIPLIAGPYKFSGLPGLIIEMISLDGDYHFELEAFQKKPLDLFSIPKNYVEMKKNKADQLIATFINDPAATDFVSVSDFGDSFDYKFKGKNSDSYKSMNTYMRKLISKYNNPIDKKTYIIIP